MAIANKKILITGATGFVGACLARRLVGMGSQVAAIMRENSDTWRINDILKDIRVCHGDLLNQEQVKRIVKDVKPDIVFHLATYGAYSFQNNVDVMLNTNILGTLHLITALGGIEYEVLVNTGSSSEYGVKDDPMAEGDLLEPINVYGVSKASASLLCQSLVRSMDLPIVTLRLFSAYGPYESGGRLIPYIITSCISNKGLDVTKGEQKRDFLFIDDILESYIAAASSRAHAGQIFNIGSGKGYLVREVIQKVVDLVGNPVSVNWGAAPYRKGEMWRWQADISKAQSVLGWKPRTSLEDGLKKTIDWFRGNLHLYQRTDRADYHASYV